MTAPRVLLLTGFTALGLVACQSAPLGSTEVSSGPARVALLPGGSCVDPMGCPTEPLLVDSSNLVLSGIAGDVPVSVALTPPAIPDARVNEEGLWQFDVGEVPAGQYVLTVVVSGEPLQAVLEIPARS